ncbi:MAG TPA: NUDIX domain-containing protein [Syntrophales bacterium]|nr:NUDIX domain-containing protein [Syntrophales bacterium]
MRSRKRIFCPYCGSGIIGRMEECILRDFCPHCETFFYDNPLPVVSAIVVRDRNVLLVKRGNKPYRGMWCLPSGFAETGESIEDAALRELEEESGIRGRIAGLIDVDSCTNFFYGDLLFVSYEVEPSGGSLRAGSDTVSAKYFPLEKTPRLAFPSNERAIKAFVRGKSDSWAIVDSFSRSLGGKQSRDKNLLSDRIVEMIEKNASRIVLLWMQDVLASRSTEGYRRIDRDWIWKGVHRIISQFGKWLGGFYSDKDVRGFYLKLGSGSRREGLILSEVLSALSLLRKHIWEFSLSQGVWTSTLDIYTALELDRRIVVFFDKAAFYASRGYESGG